MCLMCTRSTYFADRLCWPIVHFVVYIMFFLFDVALQFIADHEETQNVCIHTIFYYAPSRLIFLVDSKSFTD